MPKKKSGTKKEITAKDQGSFPVPSPGTPLGPGQVGANPYGPGVGVGLPGGGVIGVNGGFGPLHGGGTISIPIGGGGGSDPIDPEPGHIPSVPVHNSKRAGSNMQSQKPLELSISFDQERGVITISYKGGVIAAKGKKKAAP